MKAVKNSRVEPNSSFIPHFFAFLVCQFHRGAHLDAELGTFMTILVLIVGHGSFLAG
jgi:hypothetical protein